MKQKMKNSAGGKPSVYAVIMAGGSGRRFWPKSRALMPKQLLAIGARGPLVRETVSRLLPMLPAANVFISCGREIARGMARVLPGIPRQNFIIEPAGRDTAPCVGLAMHYVKKIKKAHDDDVIMVLPADHCIGAPGRFRQALKRAVRAASRKNLIVTIGIVPDRPSPAYGYLRPGVPLAGFKDVFMVRSFVEKPGPKTARRCLARGFLWNAGMFVFRLDVMMEAYRGQLPAMARGLDKISRAMGKKDYERTLRGVFPRLEKVSIDYGIMEAAPGVAVVRGDFGWCDVGGWDALYRLLGGKGVENISRGPAEFVNSLGNYVESDKLVALVGADNLVVIETEDAILVLGRESEADLKILIEQLKRGGRKDLL